MEKTKKAPAAIRQLTHMKKINSPINIYKGVFMLKGTNYNFEVEGHIFYKWFPSYGAIFEAELKNIEDTHYLKPTDSLMIIIGGLESGNCFITNIDYGSLESPPKIKGSINQCNIGDTSIHVNKVYFSIVNMREFGGTSIRKKGIGYFGRIELIWNGERIIIEKILEYSKKLNQLKIAGGYDILYNAQYTSNKPIRLKDLEKRLLALSTFLGLVNGIKVSPIFIHGTDKKNKIIWSDYSSYINDDYLFVRSWSNTNYKEPISEIWVRFNEIWKNDDYFLSLLMQWYIEANKNKSVTEAAIIFSQTALELIYNWWIVEDKKTILGQDSENISAANKIRLIISNLNIKSTVEGMKHLNQFIASNKIPDVPEAIVQIRNAIVHSQAEKRKKLKSIHYMVKYEALQVSLWYIELAFLKIMKYNGTYFNRVKDSISVSGATENVPWI